MIIRISQAFQDLLLPELRAIAPHHREAAIKRAGEEPFKVLEWAGMLLGLALTVWLTRYGTSGLGAGARLTLVVVNFLIALPLLAVLAGPFLIRRKRRGLRAFVRENAQQAVTWRPAA